MESKRIFKEMWVDSYVKRFIAIMFLVAAILFMFSSCATKKDIVYVDRYTDNQVTQVKHDTLREHTTDSIYVSVLQKGDTVYQTKYKEVVRWRDKIVERIDTIYKDKTIVEFAEKVKEVKYVPKIYRISLYISIILLIFATIKVALWLKTRSII